MTDWDAYAVTHLHGPHAYDAEPVQRDRAHRIADRCVGSVLDAGSSDGYVAALTSAVAMDISPTRAARAHDAGLPAATADATALPCPDMSFDTVILGEILEHLDNPGLAFAEACRVARERVIVSVPTRGWIDPTHQWRISLDVCRDEQQIARDPTRGEQIVLTFQRGDCWPVDYHTSDPKWHAQFVENR